MDFKAIDLADRPKILENMKTKHGSLWGNNSDYLYTSKESIIHLIDYLSTISYKNKA